MHQNESNISAQKTIVIIAAITSFIMAFTGSSLNLSVPSIGADFGVSASLVGWTITVYSLSVAAFSVPFGRLADITSRKTILITGCAIFAICSGISAFTNSFTILLMLRGAQGLGAAMVFSTNVAILISAFPPNKRGKAIGINLGATYVGLSSGPVIGGILNHQLGWESIFIFTAVTCALAFILAWRKLPKDQFAGEKRGLDATGNILFMAFIVILIFGLSNLNVYGTTAVIMVIGGIALFIAFVVYEYKQADPAVNVALFKNNIGFGLSNLSAMLNYTVSVALGYLVSLYLQIGLGYPSQTAGLVMICQPIVMALLSPQMGKLSDKVSPFKLSSCGMVICGLSASIFIFVDENTGVGVVVAALLIAGLGVSMFSSPNTNAIMSCVEKKDFGVASSLVSTMRTVGQTMGMVIVTLVVSSMMGNTPLTDAQPAMLVNVIHTCFIIFTTICFVGAVISLQRKKA